MNADLLSAIDPRELGQNLRIAREERGLRQEDAADIIGVARTTMTAIEKGQRRLNVDEFVQLIKAYGRSIGEFTRPRPTARDFQVQLRGPARPASDDQGRIVESQSRFQELCRNYLELEQIMEAPLPRKYPSEYKVAGSPVHLVAEAAATQERLRLGLGDGPLPELRPVLEQDVGLRIFCLPFAESRISEMYYYDDELGGCLAVNKNYPPERRRWSLSHGYGHFLVHRFQPVAYLADTIKREQFADYFALYFLMPASGLLRHYAAMVQSHSRLTVADLLVFANYYGVSVEALVRRLEETSVASSGTWKQLKDMGMRVRDVRAQLRLAPVSDQDDLLPLRYQVLALEALREGKISEGLFARFLAVDRLEARRIVSISQTESERALIPG